MSRIFCVVTGANRGLGKSIAESLVKTYPGISLHLTTRKLSDIENSPFRVQSIDFSHPNPVLDLCTDTEFDEYWLINNAGSLGVQEPITEWTEKDFSELNSVLAVNLTSVMRITAQFVKTFKAPGRKLVVVNVSSLAAVQEFTSWGQYCSIKAARNMFHCVLAAENPGVRVLNYSPGPLDTEMQAEVRNRGIHVMDKTMLVTPEDSADTLVKLLHDDKYTSGAHIDYYDMLSAQ